MRPATFAALAFLIPTISSSAGTAAQGSAAPQGAQPGSAAPKSSTATQPVPPAAKDLSRLLVSQQRWDQLLDRYAAALSGQVSKALSSKGEPVPADLQNSMRKQLGDRLPYQQTVDTQAQALARQFTPDELRKIADFYATPAGKKLLDRLPEAQSEVGQQLESELAIAVPEIVKSIAPKALPSPGETGTGSGESPGQGRSPSTPPPTGK